MYLFLHGSFLFKNKRPQMSLILFISWLFLTTRVWLGWSMSCFFFVVFFLSIDLLKALSALILFFFFLTIQNFLRFFNLKPRVEYLNICSEIHLLIFLRRTFGAATSFRRLKLTYSAASPKPSFAPRLRGPNSSLDANICEVLKESLGFCFIRGTIKTKYLRRFRRF